MRRLFGIVVALGLAMGGAVGLSGPAEAAIIANPDTLLLKRVGNRLSVWLNESRIFTKLRLTCAPACIYTFAVEANKFLQNDVGNNKRMIDFNATSQISGISLTVKRFATGAVKRVVFTIRPKVVASASNLRLLTDYRLRARDPVAPHVVGVTQGLVYVRVASPA